jgi:DNA-directed RNA polymerase subunit RPC12/RpoP
MTNIARGPIVLYRCQHCGKLLTDRYISKKGVCTCGSRIITGASPISILEYLKCFWWSLTLR